MTWRNQIQAALERTDGKWALADIEDRLQKRTAQLFVTENSSAVVWVDQYPRRRALTIAFGGGDLDEIVAHIPVMASYARELGCDQIDVYGRPGWARVLKQHGFKQTSVTMSMEV